MYESILHATDGSEDARRASDHAITLANDHGAKLYLLSVVDTRRWDEPALSSAELAVDAVEDAAHDCLVELRDRAEAEGVEVEMRVSHGVPYEEICDYARDVGADVILLGARGGGGAPDLGSVARRVLERADRPVFTV